MGLKFLKDVLGRHFGPWHTREIQDGQTSEEPGSNGITQFLACCHSGGCDGVDDALHFRCLPWENGGQAGAVDQSIALGVYQGVLNGPAVGGIAAYDVASSNGCGVDERLELALGADKDDDAVVMSEKGGDEAGTKVAGCAEK